MKPKLLFISNKRSLPYTGGDNTYSQTLSSGLANSIKFIVDMLNSEGIESKYVQVVDYNCIDREVFNNKPTHVIIEALWVTPSKLNELIKLHKNVIWIIRLHSEIPFLANEGIAFEWLFGYSELSENVFISTNSKRIHNELNVLLNKPVLYLPNYYNVDWSIELKNDNEDDDYINIGCFGAIRPMKNQLIQAIAAIKFSEEIDKILLFHININREETGGNAVLKNIRSLFNNTKHELIEHPWTTHSRFIKIIKKIDIGMQVSFSETYNIVAADMVNNGIPIVVSEEIGFVDERSKANPTSCDDIVHKLHWVHTNNTNKELLTSNKKLLSRYSDETIHHWKHCFRVK